MSLCTHHWCRCIRATELLWMSDHAGGDIELLREAIAVHDQQVQCRLKEPKGEAHNEQQQQ